jgi:lipopolysaccharide transport system ATP-binding protein
VAFAEIEQFIDTQVKFYSSGMYLRLAFAVAAHLEPEILIVDEVLAVGDAAFQKKCMGKMGEVSKEGRTVLLVSHNINAILNLCTQCLQLQSGRLAGEGTPRDVVMRYMSSPTTGTELDRIPVDARHGAGRVRFTRFAIEDADRREMQEILSGSNVCIRLDYASELGNELSNCRVSINIHDMLGQHLILCSTELTSKAELQLKGTGSIRFRIPRFPLSEGQYLLSLFIEVNREIEDWIESSIQIAVLEGEFYTGTRQYPPGYAGKGVLINHSWEVA